MGDQVAKDIVTSIPSDIAETSVLRKHFSQLSVFQIYKNINCDEHAQQGKATEQFYLKNICRSFLLAAEITVIMNIKYVIDRVKRIALSFTEWWCLIE